ncbi:MAG: hypothetical protein EPO68_15020 [Planctomycetota bacterium]|nr:MAG: hypothetical protein EPO68_15020 [Planctomycetota bacterium]
MNDSAVNDMERSGPAGRSASAARRGSWWLAAGAALALCAPIALAPSALAVGAGNTGANGKNSESGGGDEGIGSLPSMAGGPGVFAPGTTSTGVAIGSALSKLDAGAPNLWIEGPLGLLADSVENAWGKGYVTIQVRRGTDRARLYFHGQVKVAIQPAAFESGLVSAGVWLSPIYQGGIASIEWNGAWSIPVAVGGNVDLPIAAAAHIGVFRQGGATLHLGAPKAHKQSALAIQSQHGLLVFSQTTH